MTVDRGYTQVHVIGMVRPDPNAILTQAHDLFRRGEAGPARALLKVLPKEFGSNPVPLHLLALCERALGNLKEADRSFARAARGAADRPGIFEDWAALHARAGDRKHAIKILRDGTRRYPYHVELALALAQELFDDQVFDDAGACASSVLERHPNHPQALALIAQLNLAKGEKAVHLFAKAREAAPGDHGLILGQADALWREGAMDEAIILLGQAVKARPQWREGHAALASMRWRRGDGERFISSYLGALQQQPRNADLWYGLLGTLSSGQQYETLLRLVPAARAQLGDTRLLDMMEGEALSESGHGSDASRLFERVAPVEDPGFAPAAMRHLIRMKRADEAASLGARFLETAYASYIWPLMAAAWRLLDDPRWQWLERFDETIKVLDLRDVDPLLPELGERLRELHVARHHPFEQSPRNGTQTEGQLLDRSEPVIRKLREILSEAVGQYIRDLPPLDKRHPLLGVARDGFRFSGSWSIRLIGGGHHVNHVHPAGWISSALYIDLPPLELETRSGWLRLGEPPLELQTGLGPVRLVEPKPARLVLFPATMWHGTNTFPAGERITIAFDVQPRV